MYWLEDDNSKDVIIEPQPLPDFLRASHKYFTSPRSIAHYRFYVDSRLLGRFIVTVDTPNAFDAKAVDINASFNFTFPAMLNLNYSLAAKLRSLHRLTTEFVNAQHILCVTILNDDDEPHLFFPNSGWLFEGLLLRAPEPFRTDCIKLIALCANHKNVSSYFSILPADVIRYYLSGMVSYRLPDQVTICIKSLSNTIINLDMSLDCTVKDTIARYNKIPGVVIINRLCCEGRILSEYKTLRCCNINNDSRLHAMISTRGD